MPVHISYDQYSICGKTRGGQQRIFNVFLTEPVGVKNNLEGREAPEGGGSTPPLTPPPHPPPTHPNPLTNRALVMTFQASRCSRLYSMLLQFQPNLCAPYATLAKARCNATGYATVKSRNLFARGILSLLTILHVLAELK